MDQDLTFSGIGSTADAVLKAYSQNLWKRLQDHWTALDDAAGMEAQEFFEKFGPGKKGFWFGDVIFHVEDLKRHMPDAEFRKFPLYISDRERLMAGLTEFNYLFPEDPLIRSFLPVLLTGYLQKRQINDSFVENLYSYQRDSRRNFSKKMRMYLDIPSLEDAYPGLYRNPQARNVSSKNTKRAFGIYRQIMIFFVILRAVSHSCNVPLSFYTYDILTNSLVLLGGHAGNLLDAVEDLEPTDVREEHRQLSAEILKYIDDTLCSFSGIRTIDSDEGHPEPKWNIPFLTFLGNLRCQLYVSKGEDDFNDDSDFFAGFDWRHHCNRSEALVDGIDMLEETPD